MSNPTKKSKIENAKRYIRMNWNSNIPEDFKKEIEYRRKENTVHDEAYYDKLKEKGYKETNPCEACMDSPVETNESILHSLIGMYGGVENLLEAIAIDFQNLDNNVKKIKKNPKSKKIKWIPRRDRKTDDC